MDLRAYTTSAAHFQLAKAPILCRRGGECATSALTNLGGYARDPTDGLNRAFTGNIKSSIFGRPCRTPPIRAYRYNASDLYRTFHKRLAAEGHDLHCQIERHCQIEDDLDQCPITEGHADGYDAMVSWLAKQITKLHEQIATN